MLEDLLGKRTPEIGSNNWAISGDLTASGKPLLANDMHLAIQMPSIWYEIGLHCVEKTSACPYNVTGFSFAGAPGVIVGHNDRIAWGDTNVGPDVQDLYIEKINPDNPNQYEVNGQWVDMELLQETIQVAGGDPVELTVRYTRHGPVISDTYGTLEDFDQDSGVVAVRVGDRQIDMSTKLAADTTLTPITTDSPEGQDILLHSTSHLMACAILHTPLRNSWLPAFRWMSWIKLPSTFK